MQRTLPAGVPQRAGSSPHAGLDRAGQPAKPWELGQAAGVALQSDGRQETGTHRGEQLGSGRQARPVQALARGRGRAPALAGRGTRSLPLAARIGEDTLRSPALRALPLARMVRGIHLTTTPGCHDLTVRPLQFHLLVICCARR